LLGVQGTTFLARAVWDAGLSTESELPMGFLGTRYFQIPQGASPGPHPVALRNSSGTSSSVQVTVLAPSGAFPRPRIEDIGVFNATNAGTGKADVSLTIAAANMDTQASLSVNGSAVSPVFLWSALPIEYLTGHTPATYGYPVYHYAQVIGVVNGLTLGSTLAVTVTNTDGQTDTSNYKLPASLADLDSDGDGLLDSWESGTYTAPSGNTINLAAMGTSPRRKDILVEVDWVAAGTPNNTIWATIEDAFEAAPVLNPDGSVGANIIIDRGQGSPFTDGGQVLAAHTTMDFGPVTATSPAGYASFFDYKTNNFNADRLRLFRYCIFGRAMPGGYSGRGEIWGNDFQVTFATSANWGNDIDEVGTFIHELGHNLGLRHGGIDNTAADRDQTFKPNMPSTMNYRYQFPGVSINCDWVSEGFHTYSEGAFATINEAGVNENAGICDNTPLDMNGNGIFTNGVAINTNQSNQDGDTTDVHLDYDQWGRLLLDFDAAGSRWNNN
jgi:hypothetical protein